MLRALDAFPRRSACRVGGQINGGWAHASALYETHASTLWTLVVKERSLTSSEFEMYRGSLSSHACARRCGRSVARVGLGTPAASRDGPAEGGAAWWCDAP